MGIIAVCNTYIFGPGLPLIIFAAGLFLLIRTRFFYFLHPLRVTGSMLRGKGEGKASPLRAVMLALAGTLGVGNIVGVATAIISGGAGAVFWMWASALVSMAVKYGEIVLAVCYRREAGGKHTGGAMFYIADGLRLPRLAGAFSVLCIFASFAVGNFVQVNSAAASAQTELGIPPLVVGVAVAVITLLIVIGGVGKIMDFTVRLIPALSVAYVAFSMYIILVNHAELGDVFRNIVSSAFTPDAAGGGILGFLTMRSLRFGVARGILSNEAGCGTAPTAHAGADVKSPAEQGFWGIFEVFVDTVLLCTMTALVILVTTDAGAISGADGISLVISAYESCFGGAAGLIISLSLFFFAEASVVCWSYYGIVALGYLSKRKMLANIYLFLYSITAVIGSVAAPDTVFELSDFFIGAMTVIGTVSVCAMSGQIVAETRRYFKKPSVR